MVGEQFGSGQAAAQFRFKFGQERLAVEDGAHHHAGCRKALVVVTAKLASDKADHAVEWFADDEFAETKVPTALCQFRQEPVGGGVILGGEFVDLKRVGGPSVKVFGIDGIADHFFAFKQHKRGGARLPGFHWKQPVPGRGAGKGPRTLGMGAVVEVGDGGQISRGIGA